MALILGQGNKTCCSTWPVWVDERVRSIPDGKNNERKRLYGSCERRGSGKYGLTVGGILGVTIRSLLNFRMRILFQNFFDYVMYRLAVPRWMSMMIGLPDAKRLFERKTKKWGVYNNVIFEIYNEPACLKNGNDYAKLEKREAGY